MVQKLFLIILMLVPVSAFAQSDSVTTAINAVEAVHTEAISIVKDLPSNDSAKDFVSGSNVLNKMANSKLKALRASMEPSERRHRQAVDIFEKYCDAQTGLIQPLSARSEKEIIEKLATLEARLQKIRSEKLEALKEALKFETFKPAKLTPMPETNRPPYEKENDKGGVFDR